MPSDLWDKMKFKSIAKKIDDLTEKMKHNGSIFLATDKEVIYKKCFGYADITKNIPVTFNTQFLAGSVTKQFTAVAILKALFNKYGNDIKTALNKPIDYYLNAKHEIWDNSIPAWASKVTIHQLLIHASGIPNYTSLPAFEEQRFYKHSELINFFKYNELEFNPGEKFSYSNSGYCLLGVIIEEIAQQSFASYLENNLFKPLGMQASFIPAKGTVDDLIQNDMRFTNLARGYQYEITADNPIIEEIKRYERMEVPGAAGSLITTTEDLFKWNNALYNAKILPQSLLELMLHPYLVTERVDAYYGYGIEIIESRILGKYFSHRGGIPGFRSILTYIPLLQLSIITLQNIVSNQEKIMPEIEAIQKNLPLNLSKEEGLKILSKTIEAKYPNIIENGKRYEFAPIYDEIIKELEVISDRTK